MATEEKKSNRATLWTPPGFFSYPYFSEVDTGRDLSDEAYKVDFFITKAEMAKSGKALQDAVLEVGKAEFGSKFSLTGAFKTPFKDTDTDDKLTDPRLKGCIMIRAKSGPKRDKKTKSIISPAKQPGFYGPTKDKLSVEAIREIKGGDWGLLNVNVYAYKVGGNSGVTLALNAVQFWKKGESLGQGVTKVLDTMQELEVELQDANDII